MNTKVNIAGIEFKNPVMTASGTFGSGMEYSEFVDLNALGAVVTKGGGKRSLARQPHSPCSGGLRRHAECHRPSESRHRCFH